MAPGSPNTPVPIAVCICVYMLSVSMDAESGGYSQPRRVCICKVSQWMLSRVAIPNLAVLPAHII